MSQAASQHPTPRRSRGRRVSAVATPPASVPDLLARRNPAPPPAPQRRRGRGLLPFAIGLGLGYALAGPLPGQLAPLLAGLVHAPRSLAAMVEPLGLGNRRILVMGRDSVGDNTDVMFTVQVKNGLTQITQVPRDTYIESDTLGVLKANALFSQGGIDTTKAEVSRLVGAPVQKHFKLNLDAVAKVADALGGVEIDVPKRMVYVDNAQGLYIDLYPGRQVLKGEQLEGFLRFRHDETGDLGRMERQRLVLAQVFGKLAQPSTLTRLPALLQIAGDDILTDLSPIEITQLLSAMAHTKLSTERLSGRLYWHDNLSYWMPDSNIAHPTGNGKEPSAELSR
jgi:LCP family protein required for cell wall assembly